MRFTDSTEVLLVDFVWDFYRAHKERPTRILMHPDNQKQVYEVANECYKKGKPNIVINGRTGKINVLGVPIEFNDTITSGTVQAFEHFTPLAKGNYRSKSGEVKPAVLIDGKAYALTSDITADKNFYIMMYGNYFEDCEGQRINPLTVRITSQIKQ